MRILNKTKKNIVCEDTETARNFFTKSLGLMFRKSMPENKGFLMEFSSEGKDIYSIWMLFMRFPIDIIFIDSGKRVTDVVRNAPPVSLNPATWKVYRPSEPVRWILEMKAGSAERKKISRGDRLSFVV